MSAGRKVFPVSSGALNGQLKEILAPHRGALVLLVLGTVAAACLELAPPLLMQQVIDEHLVPGGTGGDAVGLWTLAALYLASVVGVYALGCLVSYLTVRTAQSALHRLRVRLYAHMQRLPMSYYDGHPLGDMISRCTADVDTLDALFSTGVSRLVTDLTRLITIAVTMLVLSPSLSLVLAAVIPVLLWVTNRFRRSIHAAEKESRLAYGSLNTHLQETLVGVEIIHAYGREPAFATRFRGLLRKTLQAYNQSARYSAVYSPLMQTVMAAAISLLVWSSTGTLFSSLQISLGTLTAFVLLFKRFFDPIIAVGEELQIVQSAVSGAERIFQVLNLPVEEVASQEQFANPQPAHQEPEAGIELDQVTFGYTRDRTILRQISLSVRIGEHVAIVGRTGAGKSSILNLVSGLYEPWQGTVRVAGRDPRQIDESERRLLIGVVPQTVQLFSGTVWDNLTLGEHSVPRRAVEAAMRLSGAESLVRSLPDGYDTLISQGSGCGIKLSSGQRQLLSVARALVGDPAVLIFDEATAGIDSTREAVLRDTLLSEEIRQKHAILTVAHRLATARTADRVIVLDGGRIVEQGSPDDLIRQGGSFAALLELETSGWDWRSLVPGPHLNPAGSSASRAAILDTRTWPSRHTSFTQSKT